ncbi:hypothetical protein EVAR_13687_1 [Eumeta japonica]|uniref:Uncharacterized protein n=1 Tax=Eumeta variegata TaxID=151549 RepID=A0A4C1UBE6_EUMVA|nr:hypothetical protein EVAR_13687_1 [Eumeta japonica]
MSTGVRRWQRCVTGGGPGMTRVPPSAKVLALGYGHSRRFCKEASEKCAHCGEDYVGAKCQSRSAGEPPKCINCMRAGRADTAHRAFSSECSFRQKWDEIARSKVAYC